jgi:hypothetical protein
MVHMESVSSCGAFYRHIFTCEPASHLGYQYVDFCARPRILASILVRIQTGIFLCHLFLVMPSLSMTSILVLETRYK